MDISNHQPGGHSAESAQEGERLLETVISLTGLPEPLVSKELEQILEQAGHSSGSVTLDELRQAMLLYLEQIQETVQSES